MRPNRTVTAPPRTPIGMAEMIAPSWLADRHLGRLSIRTLDDRPELPDVVEDADTFAGNARKKAAELRKGYDEAVAEVRKLIDDRKFDAAGKANAAMKTKFGGLAETMDEAIRYPIRTPRDSDRMAPCVIAGPTCDSADVLYEKAPYDLPISLTVGDEVLIECTGAYTSTYSSVAFNGFDPLRTYVI